MSTSEEEEDDLGITFTGQQSMALVEGWMNVAGDDRGREDDEDDWAKPRAPRSASSALAPAPKTRDSPLRVRLVRPGWASEPSQQCSCAK